MLSFRAALLLGCLSLALPGQDYVIDLSRLKATEKVRGIVATATEENRMTVMASGQPMHTESSRSVIRLKGDVEELGRDAAGRSRLKLTILDLECTVDGRKAEPAALGSVLTAEYKGDQTVFTGAEGKALPEEAQKLLRLVVSVNEEAGADDRAFGTKERKKVGDVWGIDRAWTAAKLREAGARVDSEDITGSVQLKEIVKDRGVDCMRIAVTLDLREIKGIPMPPGMNLTKSVFNISVSGLFPLDLTKDRQQSTEDFDADFIAYGKIPTDNGPVETTMQMHMKQASETVWTAPSAKHAEAVPAGKAVRAHP